MKAAVVRAFDRPPGYEDVPEVVAGTGEVVVEVLAAGLHPRVRSQADGSHYTSTDELPLVPGIDGVGRAADGTLRYFVLPDTTLGSMAERTVIDPRRSIELPADADPVLVAAAMNPAMSSWVALRRRIRFAAGQDVLVLGATGNAGRLAVQVATVLGAGSVTAAGRDAGRLAEVAALGADRLVVLGSGPAADAPARSARTDHAGIPGRPPADAPHHGPTGDPKTSRTDGPTDSPTDGPTASGTASPTGGPKASRTDSRTDGPTDGPTAGGTASPTDNPKTSRTDSGTDGPTDGETASPTAGETGSKTDGGTDGRTGSGSVVALEDVADVDVVIDYLWGRPMADALRVIVPRRSDDAGDLTWIQVGSVAGPEAPVPSAALRAARLSIVGSGQGSVPTRDILAELPALAAEIGRGTFTVGARPRPLADVAAAWADAATSRDRIVLVP